MSKDLCYTISKPVVNGHSAIAHWLTSKPWLKRLWLGLTLGCWAVMITDYAWIVYHFGWLYLLSLFAGFVKFPMLFAIGFGIFIWVTYSCVGSKERKDRFVKLDAEWNDYQRTILHDFKAPTLDELTVEMAKGQAMSDFLDKHNGDFYVRQWLPTRDAVIELYACNAYSDGTDEDRLRWQELAKPNATQEALDWLIKVNQESIDKHNTRARTILALDTANEDNTHPQVTSSDQAQ